MYIKEAFAQAEAASQSGGMLGLLPLVFMFVLLYFLMIRPQTKRAKEHKTMLQGLEKGDEIVTRGGTLGKVPRVGDQFVSIEISENTEISVQKPSIETLLPKGTIKNASSS